MGAVTNNRRESVVECMSSLRHIMRNETPRHKDPRDEAARTEVQIPQSKPQNTTMAVMAFNSKVVDAATCLLPVPLRLPAAN